MHGQQLGEDVLHSERFGVVGRVPGTYLQCVCVCLCVCVRVVVCVRVRAPADLPK